MPDACPGGDIALLVSTQVLGRGHDFHDVKYVVNYDMPDRIVDYVHRIGRTGRAGQKGFSLTFLEDLDLRLVKELVDCLSETSARIPDWLQEENTKRRVKARWQQWMELRRGGAPAITGSSGEGDAGAQQPLQERMLQPGAAVAMAAGISSWTSCKGKAQLTSIPCSMYEGVTAA